MTRMLELEKEIRALSAEELSAFRSWFIEFDAEAWDCQIESDIRAGKLDCFADEALAEHRAGGSTEL